MMKKKWLSVILILSLLLLSACTDPAPSQPSSSDGTQNNTDEKQDQNQSSDPIVKKDPVGEKPTAPLDVNEAFQEKISEDGLPYRIYLPEDYEQHANDTAYPLLLILHGAGERGNDNKAQLKNAVQYLFDDLDSPIYQSIVIAPQCPADEQWVDTPWANGNYSTAAVKESYVMESVIYLLEELQWTYSINQDRLYVMGLSMGGFGTWDLIMRHPEMFAGAVPICGGADTSKAAAIKHIPIYTFHGDQDTTVPVDGTRDMVEALLAVGATDVTYKEIAGAGHNVWDAAAQQDGLMTWLFAQRRNKS